MDPHKQATIYTATANRKLAAHMKMGAGGEADLGEKNRSHQTRMTNRLVEDEARRVCARMA